MEIPLILEIPEFLYNTVQDRSKEACDENQRSHFDGTLTCDTHTHRQTDTGRQLIPWHRVGNKMSFKRFPPHVPTVCYHTASLLSSYLSAFLGGSGIQQAPAAGEQLLQLHLEKWAQWAQHTRKNQPSSNFNTSLKRNRGLKVESTQNAPPRATLGEVSQSAPPSHLISFIFQIKSNNS